MDPGAASVVRFLPAAALLVLAGCAADEAPPETGSVSQVWEADLRIGAADGEGEDVFGRLAGVTLHADGRIIVVDRAVDEVRVFGPDGEFRYRIGRNGGGPGEFGGACCPAIDASGRLWIRDGGNARYQAFVLGDTAATLDSIVRMQHGDVNRWAGITFDSQGRLIDIGVRPAPDGEPRLARMHLGADGEVALTVPVHAAPEDSTGVHRVPIQRGELTGTAYLHPPLGPRELVAYGPDGTFAYALSSRPVITWFAQDGTVLREIRSLPASGPPLDAQDRAAAEAAIEADMRRTGLARGAIPFGVPDRHPPLEDLFFDRAGRLWIELSTNRAAPRTAHVYDRGGNRVRTVSWPRDVQLRNGAVQDTVAVGIASDSLGVQSVVRLKPGAHEPRSP